MVDLKSQPPNPVNLAYYCYSVGNSSAGIRWTARWDSHLKAGAAIEAGMYLQAPEAKGLVRFRLTLVQESVAWFDAPRMVSSLKPSSR